MAERHRKAPAVGLAVLGIYVALLSFSEIPLLPEGQRTEYLLGRAVVTLFSFLLSAWFWRDSRSVAANTCAGIYFVIYTVHGQWYRPLYYLGFFQLITGYALFFTPRRPVYRAVLVTGATLLTLVLALRWDALQTAIRAPVQSDIVFAIVGVSIINAILHGFVSKNRLFKELAASRFSRIGFQSARLIHDLKGLLAAPELYAQVLEARLQSSGDPAIDASLARLRHSIGRLSGILTQLNQMSGLTGRATEFTLQEMVDATVQLVPGRLQTIRLQVEGGARFSADFSAMTSLLLNLFLHSLDQFERRGTADPEIRIRTEGTTLLYSCNSGSFSDEEFREVGSATRDFALGLAIDCAESLGGSVRFGSRDGLPLMEFSFPKSLFQAAPSADETSCPMGCGFVSKSRKKPDFPAY